MIAKTADYIRLVEAINYYDNRVADLKIIIRNWEGDPDFDHMRDMDAYKNNLNSYKDELKFNEDRLRWLEELKRRRANDKKST